MSVLSQNQKIVIVNADDFGQAVSIDDAIIASHQAGMVKSASVLANGDSLHSGLEKAAQHPGLGLGIHLALVYGKPLAPSAKITTLLFENDEFARGYPKFASKYLLGGVKLSEIEYEWECQRERLRDINIDHIDSHQHLHMLPALFDLTIELARKWRVKYIRLPAENLKIARKGSTILSGTVINLFCLGKRRRLRRNALRTSDFFFGSSFSGGMIETAWKQLWHEIPEGLTEVMCHPGYENPATRKKLGWSNRWQDELDALTNPDIVKRAADCGIKFTNYSETAISDG